MSVPRQLRPQRSLFESGGKLPPAPSTTGLALNLGGNPLTNPSGLQLNSYYIGLDDVEFSQTFTLTANNYETVVANGAFVNLPFTQPLQNSGNFPQTIPQSLYVPTDAILTMHLWTLLTTQPPSNIIVGCPWAQPTIQDNQGRTYNYNQHQLPGGITYTKFGCTSGFNAYATANVTNVTVTWAVHAMLTIAFPGKSWSTH